MGPLPEGSPRPGFWVILCLTLAAMLVANLVVGTAFSMWRALNPDKLAAYQANVAIPFVRYGSALILQTALLLAAARLNATSPQKYLGLIWPPARDLLIGVTALLFFLIAFHSPLFVSLFYGSTLATKLVSSHSLGAYRAAADSGLLTLFSVFLIVVIPVGEEIAFRGFLFRGWSESPIGVTGTILLTSLLWSLTHIPSTPVLIFETFCLGVLFGWLRWRSHSTVLPIVLHSLMNLAVLVETAILATR
jgi:membrane protease YdiL (CAAX protease family)